MIDPKDRPSVADMPVRRLGVDDLRDCLLLAIDRKWLPEEAKWRLLFEVGEVYGIDDPEGGLAGTVVLSRYGPRLGAVSMVLVATRYGRMGLGGRLMRHLIRQAGDATLFLTATEYGRGLYEKLGFTAVGTVVTHIGQLRPEPEDFKQDGVRPARETDLEAIGRLDLRASGAPRAEVIRRLPRFAERTRVAERAGEVTGFGAAWRNVDNVVVGPVIAASTAMARALIAELTADLHGPVRLDVDTRHRALAEWVSSRGAVPAFSTTLMTYGGDLPGDRARLYTPVMQALG
ncbi:acetyltransferase [Sphaerisporangium krabiense]|uniref:GNAT superfamily N-acetyltransferase n=1 Tax=Sphaerisporangium krabiense TaxID=763782 RepID=A0A7W8Z535_9ACTN|nr:GNAT family N-acetyltransferase [Sphaerisporangium krabiense]MBB5627574.1 GNAT superfamily N-acetyltransferase [Sphaerisporangium krabiense]GII66589.1 acetyltransferase [Sphaerisporangium krabiense]